MTGTSVILAAYLQMQMGYLVFCQDAVKLTVVLKKEITRSDNSESKAATAPATAK